MALLAIGLFLVAYQWGNQWQVRNDRPPVIGGVLLLPPQPMPDLDLRASADGRVLGRAQLLERWTLVTLASPASADGHLGIGRMVEVANRLVGEPRLRERLGLWLVSADDAPALARDFERLGGGLAVLTADGDQLARLRAALGLDPTGPDDDGDAGDPTPPLFLIDPQARLLALFPGALAAPAIAEDLIALDRWPGLAKLASGGSPVDAPGDAPIDLGNGSAPVAVGSE